MTSKRDIAGRVERWLYGAALPLWAERGVRDGLFFDELDREGRPIENLDLRLRVQARQLFVFSACAPKLSLPSGFLTSAFETMKARCWASDDRAGWVSKLTPDGRPADPRRDTYDHAFALFALAEYFRRSGDVRARELARETLDYMDRSLAHPLGGYREGDPAGLPRRQNPHMHLLEALLAWAEIAPDGDWLARANALLDLFETRFFDEETGTLGEFFGEDWVPAQGPVGAVVEPGHHFEWVWLLERARRLGARDLGGHTARLYDFAVRHGLDAAGFAVDECDRGGAQTVRSRRAWPQTEMIKAHVAMAERGEVEPDVAYAAAERFSDVYLAGEPGLWVDQFGADGLSATRSVKASSLYHIALAFLELLRLDREAAAVPARAGA
jgi:mannose-6-phosphate isomerase